VAFSIEAHEKGLLEKEDLGGLVPAWGSREYALAVLEKISCREGVGDLLAEGVREAARRLGAGAPDIAVHAQGLEVPMQDPRAFVSLALTYAVSPRGASHCESMSFYTEQGFDLTDLGFPDGTKLHQAEGKGEMTAVMQDMATVYDSLGLCKFMLVAGIGPTTLAQWVEAATGWEMNRDELMAAGARTVAAKRLYNLDRLGLSPEPHLALRMRLETRGTGGSANSLPDLDTMVKDYYRARGWSEEGRPPDDQKPR